MSSSLQDIAQKLQTAFDAYCDTDIAEQAGCPSIEQLKTHLTDEELKQLKQYAKDAEEANLFTKNRKSSKCKKYTLPHWNCTGDCVLFKIPCDHYSEEIQPSIVVAAGYMQYKCTCSKGYYKPYITVRVNPDVP